MLKKLILILAVTLSLSYIFGLTAGDIAILGVNTDATKSLAFVALADIPANTTISFTDNAWNATTQTWRTGEGTITWTHTALVAKGTVVTITLGATYAADLGTVTTNTNFNLSATGDQILAYEGTTAPTTNADATWLFGFSIENWVWADNSNTSDIPTALIGASVGLTSSTTEFDNGYFANGNTTQTTVSVSGTKAALLVLFCDNTKYFTNDAGPLTFPAYTITVSGGVTPTINVSGTLPEFTAYTGTPSVSEAYTLSGSNLTGNISVAALNGFQYSTDNSTWASTLSLPNTFNGGVYVRLSGANVGTFSGNIVHSSPGATPVNLAASGTVSNPVPTIHVGATLTPFATTTGTPSAAQVYNLDGSFLTANIVVTPPAGYEMSTNGTTYSSSLSVGPEYSGVAYIRLTGSAAGTFNGTLSHTSAGATQVDVPVSGMVTDPVGATTFIQEDFNYEAGTNLTANGWTAHSTGSNPIVVGTGSLGYPNYPPFSGNKAVTMNTGEDVNRLFTGQTSGAVYTAFVATITSASTTGDYFYHLCSNPINSSFYRGRLFVQKDASNNLRFGVSNAGAVGTAQFTGYSYSLNTPYLFLLKYELIDGANNDIVKLWVNPDFSGSEPAAQVTTNDAITSEPSNIGAIALRQGGTSSGAAFEIDGIRVTNDWAELWSGEAPPTPVIIVTGTLDPLACIVGSASEEITQYTLNGTDLQSGITVTAPTHFQVSLSATEGWAQSILVPSTSLPATIYVRMYATLAGDQAGNIVHTSPNADPVNLRVEGTAYNPTVIWNNPASLPEFSSEANTPSAAQSYTLSATNATADLSLNTAAPFEISTASSGPWGYTLVLPYNFNSSIFVRFNPTSAGTFNGEILHDTADATQDAVLLSGTATPQAGMAVDLFFSEYIEGSSSNKALEIFNGTGGAVDLSNYKVELYANGSTTAGNTLTFTAGTMLAHNDVYVIAHSSANATILGLADVTSTVTFFNGDDAVALKKISTDSYVDIFGVIGQDPDLASTPALGWIADGGYATVNKTLVRKPNVSQGVSVNPTMTGPNVNTDFVTLATEWDVYATDTLTYLGSHTFNPGGNPMAATPTFNPPAGNYFSPINVTIASTTPGATIRYTTNGDVPNASSTLYTAPVAISATTTLKAIAFATGFDPSSVAVANYSYPTDVANIAALRAMPTGATVYRLTGEAVLTFQQATRHQKYIQDATAAVLIDDPTGIITTTYNLYDGITRIAGTLALYNGLLQFTPVADPGAATSSGNVIVPAVRTLATITSDDQAKLLRVLNVTIDATTVNFQAVAENINVTDASGTLVMRTFPATDYSNTAIPTAPVDIVCLGGQFNTTMQISPRFLADITAAAGTLEAPIINISQVGGTVSLSWAAVAGATSYRIEAADDPYGTFTELSTTANLFYSGAATAMKFYRVIALN